MVIHSALFHKDVSDSVVRHLFKDCNFLFSNDKIINIKSFLRVTSWYTPVQHSPYVKTITVT
jgi:hypothetical protein